MDLITPAAIFFIAMGTSAILTKWLIPHLNRFNVMDVPNARSNHDTPVPRGGGIGPITAIILGLIVLGAGAIGSGVSMVLKDLAALCAAVIILAGVSFYDDIRGLSPALRLAVQFAAAALVLAIVPFQDPIFQGLFPSWLDTLAALILWVWFVNLFNFMDGVDGIAGVETLAIGLGLFIVVVMSGRTSSVGHVGVLVAGSGLGFLFYNWAPAKIFLGDAGSVPLGFLLGWLLLDLAASGLWAAALILPLYFLTDSTLTLYRRALRGDAVWRAHKEHFYQQAVAKGMSHARVSSSVAVANIVLIGLAITSAYAPISGLIAGGAVVCVLLLYFKQSPRQTGESGG